jgi:hypothetical protein
MNDIHTLLRIDTKDNGTAESDDWPSFNLVHTSGESFYTSAHHHTDDSVFANHSHFTRLSTQSHVGAIYHERLPEGVNIFNDIPEKVLKDKRVKAFIDRFIVTLQGFELNDITFPKLKAYISEDNSISINWIFNYFRLYFSFEEDPKADNYGTVEKISSHKSLNIQTRQLSTPYTQAINEALAFVLERI